MYIPLINETVKWIVGTKIKNNSKYLILIYFVDKLESLSFRSFKKIVPKSSKKGIKGKKYLVNLTWKLPFIRAYAYMYKK